MPMMKNPQNVSKA